MRTRLFAEQLIKQRFPQLRYVRIHTDGNHRATIYAWNEELHLPDKDIRSLRQFAADYLHSHTCFKVKPYHLVQEDMVPQVSHLPEELMQAALNRVLDLEGILEAINSIFSYGELTFNQYDMITGVIHFDYHSESDVPPNEQELMSQYLYEMVPIGSKGEVTFIEG
ncbi:hypothetical protein ACFQ88_09725 [Paenibacillus sp. NPDC056579]|uniref:hypothetical protein n=1 Tax=unclassified Paenibacillus TaxID=185978 RepID=UPI001EF89F67|nr:hypothetical protein [Paenibacillus sp. H1-7]